MGPTGAVSDTVVVVGGDGVTVEVGGGVVVVVVRRAVQLRGQPSQQLWEKVWFVGRSQIKIISLHLFNSISFPTILIFLCRVN